MTSRRSIIGTLCLCVLGFCAIAVADASAVTIHECKEAAAGETTQQFSDSACTTKLAGGKFRTVPIPKGETVQLKGTSTETSTLATTIVGIKFRLTCATGNGTAEATNEEPAAGVMRVSGKKIIATFSKCEVKEPAGKGCKVTEPITTLEMNSITSEMKDTLTPVNAEGKFTTITISSCEGVAAPLNGAKPITGVARGINQESDPTSTEFTATSGSELKLGGQTATITGKTHSATAATGALLALKTP